MGSRKLKGAPMCSFRSRHSQLQLRESSFRSWQFSTARIRLLRLLVHQLAYLVNCIWAAHFLLQLQNICWYEDEGESIQNWEADCVMTLKAGRFACHRAPWHSSRCFCGTVARSRDCDRRTQSTIVASSWLVHLFCSHWKIFVDCNLINRLTSHFERYSGVFLNCLCLWLVVTPPKRAVYCKKVLFICGVAFGDRPSTEFSLYGLPHQWSLREPKWENWYTLLELALVRTTGYLWSKIRLTHGLEALS